MRGNRHRARIPVIFQTTATDCGAACLAMILASYGKHVSLREVRDKMNIQREGVSAYTVLQTAEQYGLNGKGVAVAVSELKDLPLPAILHWDANHFVLLVRWKGAKAEVVDPAVGRQRISEQLIKDLFRGSALLFEPAETFSCQRPPRRAWRRYFEPFLATAGIIIRIFSLALVLRLLGLGLPFLTAAIIDRIIPHRDYSALALISLGMAVLMLSSAVGSTMRSLLLIDLRTRLSEHMMSRFFQHLLFLPFSFFERHPTGDLLVRIGSNTAVREVLSQQCLTVFSDAMFTAVYLVLMLVYSVPLSAVVLVLGGVEVALSYWSLNAIRPLIARDLQAQTKNQSYLVEALRGIEAIKIGAAETRTLRRWKELFLSQLQASAARERKSSIVGSYVSGVSMAGPLVLLLAGTALVLRGNLTAGQMLAFNALAGSFLGPLTSLFSSIQAFQLASMHFDRLDEIFETPLEQLPEKRVLAPELRGSLALEDVSFRYGPHASLVLDHVDVEVHSGMMVAVVGVTGSGKSTLAKLLTGLYKPTSGRVLFDGNNLEDLDIRNVRQQLGVVPQGSILFNDSIRGNIAFHNPDVPLPDIEAAARLAEIADEIETLPLRYETTLSEMGRNFSGGQRQRLCLARALVNRPKILILDEATSEVDLQTEARIYRNLAALGCTQIIVAHRIRAIRQADLILVMDHGVIVERGTHDELVREDRRYARLLQTASPRQPAKQFMISN